jgi:hypothetical protein
MKTINIAAGILLTAAVGHAQQKPRVFVTDSQSWETSGALGGSSSGFGGAAKGGARP